MINAGHPESVYHKLARGNGSDDN